MTKDGVIMTSEEVVDRYADMVYRLALTEVKNKADADDVFQEVFVRLVKHLHKLKTEEHIKAWLLRVTINCSKKHFTNYWNRNVYSMEEEDRFKDAEASNYEMEIESPITEAVSQLPPKYRGVVHMFYYEELSVSEIAEATGQKETTVKSQLFRAREMLREKLKEDI